MKKFFVLLLALLMVLSCMTGAVAEEKPTVTIRILLNGNVWGNADDCTKEIFDAFAAKYADEVTLIAEPMPSEGQEAQVAKLRIMAQSGDAPGVFGGSVNTVAPFAEAGILQDLNTIVDDEWKSMLMDNVEEQYTMNGMLIGVPQQVGVQGWYYNKALFDQCGLEIPETFDDLLNCIEVFNANGIIPIAQSGMDSWSVWGYQYYFHRFGFLDMVKPILNHEMKFNNEKLLKGFQKLDQLQEAGAFPESMSSIPYDRAKEMFMSGQAAMFNSGTWESTTFAKSEIAENIEFNFGPTFADGIEQQKMGVKQVGQGMYACNTKDPLETEWSLKFIKFWAEEEANAIKFDKLNWVTGTKHEVDTSSMDVVSQKCYAAAIDDSTPVTLEVSMMFPSSFTNTYWQGVIGVLNGNMTPEEALNLYDEWNETRTD